MVFICMLFFSSSCSSLVSDIATRVWDNWYSTADLQLEAQCSYFVPMCQPPPPAFFFTFLGRIQDLFSYLFLDLFFLYFFPELKTKRFTFCQAAPWGSRAQFFSAERIVPFPRVVKRPSLWLYVISQNARLHGPPGSVTRNTRDKFANPRPFLFIPIQIEKWVCQLPWVPETAYPIEYISISDLPLEAPSSSLIGQTQSICLS